MQVWFVTYHSRTVEEELVQVGWEDGAGEELQDEADGAPLQSRQLVHIHLVSAVNNPTIGKVLIGFL